MNDNLSAVSFGHFVMKVSDIDISYQFYTKLGLRPFGIYPERLMEMSQVATVGGTLEAPARSEAAPWVSGCARRFVLSGW
jgi:catechol 2,3-dioxygenase-like lactoylglutathione lyase family enzyme